MGRRGLFALADQGVVSAGTFLTNIVLARYLAPAEYGIYALVFGILILLNGLSGAVVVYPLSLKGAVADETELRKLTATSISVAVWLVLSLGTVVLVLVCAAGGRIDLAPWALAALLWWQVQETLRRAFIAHLRYRAALLGDVLSYMGQAGVVWALAGRLHLSIEAAFAAIALTSALATAVQAAQLGIKRVPIRGTWQATSEALATGRWVLLTTIVSGVAAQGLGWTLVALRGFAEGAALQAVSNVLKVTHPLVFSMTNIVVPLTARMARERGLPEARRTAVRSVAGTGLILATYYVVVFTWPGVFLTVLYGSGSAYLTLQEAVRLLVIAHAFTYMAQGLEAFLNGLAKSREAFRAQLAGAVAAVVVGIPLVILGGLIGAIAASLIVALVRVGLATRYASRVTESRT